ncbi:hypothetical protein MSPP1_000985 [Malassezia sp. CBS 17886]|nr:hypothetical protein MSPP1_000985 [Malassezia sp. CBS 17886]
MSVGVSVLLPLASTSTGDSCPSACKPPSSRSEAPDTFGLAPRRPPYAEPWTPRAACDAAPPGIYAMTPAQLSGMYREYAVLDVPHDAVFPYLHCGHSGSASQNLFFHGSPGKIPMCPRYRGLMVVRADTGAAEEQAPRAEEDSATGVTDAAAGAAALSSPPAAQPWTLRQPAHSLLISTFAPHEILTRCADPERSTFLTRPPPEEVSLRTFSAQGVNYARIADIVLYAPHGDTPELRRTARALRAAQRAFAAERRAQGLGGLEYNVFVVSAPFAVLDASCPELVALDARGRRRHYVDFFERERDEIHSLTRATPIAKNVWLGSSRDFAPSLGVAQDATQDSATCATFSIGLEMLEDGEAPPPAFLHTVARSFEMYDRALAAGTPGQVPTAHFECPAGLALPVSLPDINVTSYTMLLMCRWLYELTQPGQCAFPRRARRALIHCADGYTESSAFALSYLMYTEAITLAEAYLALQLRLNRSFFVQSKDVLLLQATEARLKLMREGGGAMGGVRGALGEGVGGACRGAAGTRTEGGSSRGGATEGGAPGRAATPSPTTATKRGAAQARRAAGNTRPSPEHASDWMDDEHFEGCFPSRILPFLYLGSLNHALNVRLLTALGITHVVSVGESAMRHQSRSHVRPAHALRAAHECGAIDVLDVADVGDDGVDSLRATMCTTAAWIDRARTAGGRVLVHCRVGVSRSATIVIAYLMAHLDLALVDAYLLVRSRRLNVLIQPNLLFVWELRGWEAFLAAHCARGAAPPGAAPPLAIGAGRALYPLALDRCHALGSLVYTWASLCREIATLNERYLIT